ncbi:hypothetical protein HFN20_25785 [Paenibacillus dendritiformis]|uniref:hypothetical protein n=1 Tax=Paenibacillus dendritiformis TaxID=130049 RepID=UPI00143E00BF|nr:hypothetical protein [Paenibacillus dendritiformis]NKI24566.1 hypothetical protein [Paenibacillus dendritiformis]NRF99596.1 hypothetical protein [Paenibacillus dendritiformis]
MMIIIFNYPPVFDLPLDRLSFLPRLDSFLLLYVKAGEDQSGIRQVGRYDEVTEEAIPAKARAKLGAE